MKFLICDDPQYLLDCWERDGLRCYLWDTPENRWWEEMGDCPILLRVYSLDDLKKQLEADWLIFETAENPQKAANEILKSGGGGVD